MTKSELRKIYLLKQNKLLPSTRAEKSAHIAAHLFHTFDLSKIGFLHCFIPIEKFNEVDTRPIFQKIWKEHPNVQTVVPRVNFQTHEMECLRYTPETALVQNEWQVEEPLDDGSVEAAEIDTVLVPGLCFDKRGHRVGYGKGFYDRFLKRCRPNCVKIGLSLFPPVETIADTNEFDVLLNFLVTPNEVFRPEKPKLHAPWTGRR